MRRSCILFTVSTAYLCVQYTEINSHLSSAQFAILIGNLFLKTESIHKSQFRLDVRFMALLLYFTSAGTIDADVK